MKVRYYAKQRRGPAKGIPIETDHATFASMPEHGQTTFHGEMTTSTYRTSADGNVVVERRVRST